MFDVSFSLGESAENSASSSSRLTPERTDREQKFSSMRTLVVPNDCCGSNKYRKWTKLVSPLCADKLIYIGIYMATFIYIKALIISLREKYNKSERSYHVCNVILLVFLSYSLLVRLNTWMQSFYFLLSVQCSLRWQLEQQSKFQNVVNRCCIREMIVNLKVFISIKSQ